jgi:hypothetical protein
MYITVQVGGVAKLHLSGTGAFTQAIYGRQTQLQDVILRAIGTAG